MKLEDLKAGMIIRITPGYYVGPWANAKLKILTDYDDIYWEDDDGHELEEPFECEVMEDIRDDQGVLICRKGKIDMFHIDETYRGKPGFMICYTKTNKPEWF